MSGGVDADAPIAVAVTGAAGEFGRTFLAQLRAVSGIRPTLLVDLDLPALARMLDELAYRGEYIECGSAAQVVAAVEAGRIALAETVFDGLGECAGVLVEASGDVSAGFGYAAAAIDQGRHVVMVSKEVESVAGPWLAARAAERGVRYLCGRGDQPANLLALMSWVQRLGLEVVAVGKSSEYDLVYDPATGWVSCLQEGVEAPELTGLLDARTDTRHVLAARHDTVASLVGSVAADLCEMGIVASRLGFAPNNETLHYPVARVGELADVYAPRADGGIVETAPTVDVFTMLRLPNEASFAGGVFAVVRTGDRATWQVLAAKGHVVSRSGRYACVFWPYHLMGVETPLSVFDAVREPPPDLSASSPRAGRGRRHVLAGRAARDLGAGHVFRVAGHHHRIEGVQPVLVPDTGDIVPFYLLDRARLVAACGTGELLRFDQVSGLDPRVVRAHRETGGHRT